MATRIEIRRIEHSGLYEIRVGDITGYSNSSNITKRDLINGLLDEVDKLDNTFQKEIEVEE